MNSFENNFFKKETKEKPSSPEIESPVVKIEALAKEGQLENRDVLSENNIKHIDRLICDKNVNEEEAALELVRRSIKSGEKMPYEIEKDEEMLSIIKNANQVANNYAQSYGVEEPFNIPLENLHVVEHGISSDGVWSQADCQIMVKKRQGDTKIDLTSKIFHELVHSKSYNVIKAELKDEKINLIDYSSGIGINLKRKDGQGYETNNLFYLNEAVTQMLTEKFIRENKNNNQPSPEERLEYKQNIGSYYPDAQLEFSGLVRKIYENNTREYFGMAEPEAIDKIKDEFSRAYFTGEFLKLGRLVENTFGPGSLKQLNRGPYDPEGIGFENYRNKFISQDASLDDLG